MVEQYHPAPSAAAAIPRTPLEVYDSLPEGTRVELINNTILTPPAPEIQHQRTSVSLTVAIANFVDSKGLGELFHAPIDVRFDDQNSVQPDLIFILTKNLAARTDNRKHVAGPPDLVIEILSPGNRAYDLQTKKELYERFGVKEYFIIEPETGLAYHFYLGEDGQYELTHQHIRKLESQILGHTFSW